jgi:hypothetical protein
MPLSCNRRQLRTMTQGGRHQRTWHASGQPPLALSELGDSSSEDQFICVINLSRSSISQNDSFCVSHASQNRKSMAAAKVMCWRNPTTDHARTFADPRKNPCTYSSSLR